MNRLLPFLLMLICSAALAESGAYRVEVIVFRHLQTSPEPTNIEQLRSFSRFPSAANLIEGNEAQEARPAELSKNLPDELRVLPAISDYMNDVWKRLRSSQNYRPLVYSAWEQNRTDYYPPMRVHDATVIATELRPPTSIMVADLTADDPLARYRSTFYQLDGNVQLRRSRFLHLYLDLEYRVSTAPGDLDTSVEDIPRTEAMLEMDIDNTATHEIFALKQNRQIRTGDVQYFDTPFLGALVFVSAIPAN